MKKTTRKFLLSLLSLLITSSALYSVELKYKITSWNVKNFGKRASVSPEYEDRRTAMKSLLNSLAPDILAVQEILSKKSASVFRDMAGENFSYNCSKFSGTRHQGNCVYWNNKRFRIKEVITPELDTQHPPVAVYLEDKKTGFDFFMISVHLKFGKSIHERINELDRIIGFIRDEIIPCDPDVIIAGDFNLPVEVIKNYLPEKDFTCYIGDLTSRNREGNGASNYDHFIVSAAVVENSSGIPETLILSDMVLATENRFDDLRISDHFPVLLLLDMLKHDYRIHPSVNK